MVNRINPAQAKLLGGFKVESTPEMMTVEQLQDQLKNVIAHGERIIQQATEEIMKRNACLEEGVRVMRLCREALLGGNSEGLLEQIDRWVGPPESK